MTSRALWIAAAAAVIAATPGRAESQLRPLEQGEWGLLAGNATVAARVGMSRLFGQRASLAGTEGDLWEAGSFNVAWRTGRVVLEAGGTAQRFFRERERFAEPWPDVDPSGDGRRHDSGDYRVSTAVRLTPDRWPVAGGVRFGTRLPSTDNETGLDRDAIDFFATLGAAGSAGRLAMSGEAGLGINSTREQRFEQDDLVLYSLRAELRRLPLTPSIEIAGQLHGPSHESLRGVEDLGELRIGLRAGNRVWAKLQAVKGYETFSPSSGVILTAGLIR